MQILTIPFPQLFISSKGVETCPSDFRTAQLCEYISLACFSMLFPTAAPNACRATPACVAGGGYSVRGLVQRSKKSRGDPKTFSGTARGAAKQLRALLPLPPKKALKPSGFRAFSLLFSGTNFAHPSNCSCGHFCLYFKSFGDSVQPCCVLLYIVKFSYGGNHP